MAKLIGFGSADSVALIPTEIVVSILNLNQSADFTGGNSFCPLNVALYGYFTAYTWSAFDNVSKSESETSITNTPAHKILLEFIS